MKRQRSFGGTTSPTSVFLGFLDVITCGFAAALVLGIIFSIVQPYGKRSAVPQGRAYAYYRFTTVDADQSRPGHRVILLPVLFYKPPDGQPDRVPLPANPEENSVVATNLPFRVSLQGFSLDYDRLFTTGAAGQNAADRRLCWNVLVTMIPPGWKVDVQTVFSNCEGLEDYLKPGGGVLPSVRIMRRGPDAKEHEERLIFGTTPDIPQDFLH